jgi:threonine/homoserine/homoserine lactone efflux protein
MAIDAFLVGVVAGFGIAIPVGAIAILIVQVGMRCGFACAASAGAAAASADLAYSVLAVTGGAALAATVADLGEPFRWLSAAVLAAMAIHGLAKARRQPPVADAPMPRPREYASTYARFLGLTIINPLTVVYFAAVVLGLGLAEDLTGGQAALFVTGAFLASLSWQTLLAGVGAGARRRLPRRFVAAAIVAGNLLVLGMAIWIVLR